MYLCTLSTFILQKKKNSRKMKQFSTTKTITFELLLNQLISVSKNDEFIAPIEKWKAHSNTYLASSEAFPHRAFSIFLFNSRNQLLLQQRSKDKRTFPLCWTNTCCSHPNMIKLGGVLRQQPIRASLERALHRELRMDLNSSPFYFMNKILYKQLGFQGNHDFGEYELDYVYINKISTETLPFTLVPQEVADVKWINKDQLNPFMQQIIKQGGYFSPWFLKIVQNGLLSKWWQLVQQNKLKDQDGETKFQSLKYE